MRADRAYIAGLGTTSILVASALLLLAVVSTLVAFRGWPGTDVADDIGNLIVGESERPLAVDEGPARTAREAAPAAGAVAETSATETPASAPAPAPAAPAAAPTRVGGPSFVQSPGGVTIRGEARLDQGTDTEQEPLRDQSPSSVSLLPQTPVSAEVQRVTTGLGDTTQRVTDGLGQTVGGLNPMLGATLTDTGRVLADLVRGLGRPAG